MSVAGPTLSFPGILVTQLTLHGCDYSYDVEFMACNNLSQPLPCIIGCDFIAADKLQLSFSGFHWPSWVWVYPFDSLGFPVRFLFSFSHPLQYPQGGIIAMFHAVHQLGLGYICTWLIAFIPLVILHPLWLLKPLLVIQTN